MEGRSRRVATQSKGRLNAKDALSKLKAAREGGDKRALTYEAKKEEGLYDVLEDEEYAKLVAKRRDEGVKDGNALVPLVMFTLQTSQFWGLSLLCEPECGPGTHKSFPGKSWTLETGNPVFQ
eukprot:scaffold4607_cov16-Tisochrysis_lutea.AAC.1